MKLLLILLTMFASVDSIINQAIHDTIFPGAVFCYVENDQIVYLKAYGNRSVEPTVEPMTTNTIFDLASCSKSTGAGSAAYCLIKEGKLRKTDKVCQYIPDFPADCEIQHLMHHTSGLPGYLYAVAVDNAYREAAKTRNISRPQFLMDTICRTPRLSAVGEKYRYSCLNLITLQNVIERIVGTDLNTYMRSRVYGPIGATTMGWLPDPKNMNRIAPTEHIYSGYMPSERTNPLDSTQCIRGVVHDPLARLMNNGISGNAGVFATAEDLAKWCMWIMHQPQSDLEAACYAALWPADDGSYRHTGYTGTAFRIYFDQHRAMILLTNRVHPFDTTNYLSEVNRKVVEAVNQSVETKK